jgi:PD-(D/E)XK nuclease superfamily
MSESLTLSYSKLLTYECPRRYKYRYIERLPEGENDDFVLGRWWHEWWAAKLRGEPEPPPIIPIHLIAQWHELLRRTATLDWDRDTILGVEHDLSTPLTLDDGRVVTVRGRLDLFLLPAPNHAHVIDFKTQWVLTGNARENPQLLLYAWLVMQQFSVESVQITLFGVRDETQLSAIFNRDELRDFEHWLKQRAATILDDTRFEPRPSDACMSCPFLLRCDAAQAIFSKDVSVTVANGKFSVTLNPISAPEQAVAYARMKYFARAVSHAFDAPLREWTRTNGPIDITSEHRVGFFPVVTQKVSDIMGFVRILRAKGLPPLSYLRADMRRVKPLAKKYPELNSVLSESHSTRFDIRRITAQEEIEDGHRDDAETAD